MPGRRRNRPQRRQRGMLGSSTDADNREIADEAIKLCWREIRKLGRMAKTFSGLAGKKGLRERGQ